MGYHDQSDAYDEIVNTIQSNARMRANEEKKKAKMAADFMASVQSIGKPNSTADPPKRNKNSASGKGLFGADDSRKNGGTSARNRNSKNSEGTAISASRAPKKNQETVNRPKPNGTLS